MRLLVATIGVVLAAGGAVATAVTAWAAAVAWPSPVGTLITGGFAAVFFAGALVGVWVLAGLPRRRAEGVAA